MALTNLPNCLIDHVAKHARKEICMAFDNHIELPGLGKRGGTHPAFKEMAVGDSVFAPHDGAITSCAAYLYAKTIQKRNKAYRFAGRSVTENGVVGVRIWRTA